MGIILLNVRGTFMLEALFGSQVQDRIFRFFSRFLYPVSLPEDVAAALGFTVSNLIPFEDFLGILTSPCYQVNSLYRLMPRSEAEHLFSKALRKECFHQRSIYAYYFRQGWIEFILQFDEKNRLRRMYMQHRDIPHDQGWEMCLTGTERSVRSTKGCPSEFLANTNRKK